MDEFSFSRRRFFPPLRPRSQKEKRKKRKKGEKKGLFFQKQKRTLSLEGLRPDLLGDLERAVDVVLAVEEDLGLDDRAQAGGCGEEKKREIESE